MIEMVLGFLFSTRMDKVALIKKSKPAWQEGMWNGIGGKVDPGETPKHAMIREFEEEAGLRIENWRYFGQMQNDRVRVSLYVAVSDDVDSVQTTTEEEVRVFPTRHLPHTVYNLRWLLPLAKDRFVTEASICLT